MDSGETKVDVEVGGGSGGATAAREITLIKRTAQVMSGVHSWGEDVQRWGREGTRRAVGKGWRIWGGARKCS